MSTEQSVDDLLADLNATFGKKPKGRGKDAPHKALNKAWHEANQPIGKAKGKAPERLNPEDSTAWRPVARITHICIQECATCADCIEFIGGEFIKFRSTLPFGGEILRRAEVCSTLFLFTSLKEPLEDVLEYHYQKVGRCSGCIRVEQQAKELWEEQLLAERKEAMQLPLIDVTQPLPKRLVSHTADNDDDNLRIEGL